MIKINNDEYDQYDIKISWGKFVAFSHGEKKLELRHLLLLI